MQSSVPSERTIDTSFPLAHLTDATPYHKFRFDGEVREFCDQDVLTPKNNLRVAKCIFVGDIAVGKTCVINRFGYGIFTNNYKATIGVDFDVQKFSILNLPFTLQIWDTAGQERFKCIATTYYRGAHVAVIVFDMSNVSSLASARKWLQEVLDSNQQKMPLVFLVGNKKELLCESAFAFMEKEAIKIAGELKAEYWSVSAQTGENIHELFSRIAALTFQEMIWREIDDKVETSKSQKRVSYSNKFIKLTREKKATKNCISVTCLK
jgi:small GTP-binding protein